MVDVLSWSNDTTSDNPSNERVSMPFTVKAEEETESSQHPTRENENTQNHNSEHLTKE